MYIRPKLLWWLIPILLGLFLLGIVLGTVSRSANTGSTDPASAVRQTTGTGQTTTVAELLEQITQDEERSFLVYMKDQTLHGRFQNEQFQLAGEIGGHQLEIARKDGQPVSVRIDGQIQDHAALPYALFTPYEHAVLLKGVMQSVRPERLEDTAGQGWSGYRIAVPPEKVSSLLSMWLGPSFPIHDLTSNVTNGMKVNYQLWYESTTGQLRQLELDLQIQTAVGVKRDQLRFRL
ncbi:hypothetical protein HP567_016245 [Brevibacillus sp. M2.1A]|uniref:hypothetical protein n=1 Tax=Brevibacillus sp. M2.1A TaxID=2738980 RepID=UPI00156B5608|nr:hypothetical protein [Brevibacillus sp. M2.1A]MCC8436096.1 hypothetical protein [Brevibacillus sp. M2.1A]